MAKAPQISFKTDLWRLLFLQKSRQRWKGQATTNMCSIMALAKKHISMEKFQMHFAKTTSRGPDMSRVEIVGDSVL